MCAPARGAAMIAALATLTHALGAPASVTPDPPVDQGEAPSEAPGAPPKCPDDIAAIARAVLDDASTRAQRPSLASHDGGFFIASPDQRMRLNIGGYIQFRYLTNVRNDSTTGSDVEHGFDLTRVRLIFAGSLKSPGIDFLILPYARSDGSWTYFDAWARHTFANGWSVKAGQAKVPFLREYLVSERFLLAAERSMVTAVFSPRYAEEVETCYTGEHVGFHFSVFNGMRTQGQGVGSDRVAEYALAARVEYKFQGAWKQFFDMTAHGNDQDATMIGGALLQQGPTDEFAGVELESLTQYTIDVWHEGLDWSVQGAFVGRHAEVGGEGWRSEFGAMAQAALLPARDFELFARGSILIPDPDVERDETFSTVTLGFNYYFHGHAAKLTTDLVWYLDATTETDMLGFGTSSALGLLPSAGSDQLALRAQFQLIF